MGHTLDLYPGKVMSPMVHCRERLASARGSRLSHGEAPRRLGLGWLATVLAALAAMPHAKAQTPVGGPLDIPARTAPAPTADISPGMQALVAAPLNPDWDKLWKTGEEARAFADAQAAKTTQNLPAMRERLHVSVESTTIDGVKVHILTPGTILPENRNRVLIHVHGGCYVLFPGESGTTEGLMMATGVTQLRNEVPCPSP